MKTMAVVLLALLILVPPVRADNIGGDEDGMPSWTAQAGLDYSTIYFWRGDSLYGDTGGVFFPSARWRVFDTGVMLEWQGEYARNDRLDWLREKNAADFGAQYEKKAFSGLLHATAEVWYSWFYNSGAYSAEHDNPRYDDSNWTGSLMAEFELPFVHPSVMYVHDYYANDRERTRRIGQDWCLVFKLSFEREPVRNVFAILSVAASYFRNRYADDRTTWADETRDGWSDITTSLQVAVARTGWRLWMSGNWANRPDPDWYREREPDGREFNVFNVYWFACGGSISF